MLDGDSFVVKGQKVLTSGAHDADYILAFVRTDPDVPKHKGISVLVAPTDLPGLMRKPFASLCRALNLRWRSARIGRIVPTSAPDLGGSRRMHYTHYWATDTADREERTAQRGDRLEHVAGNVFRARRVSPGDTIHVITFAEGTLRVLGRMVVDAVVDTKTAERLLGTTDLWEATEHCIARKGAASRLRFDAVVPDARISDIEFVDRNGKTSPPASNANGEVDPQTFRGVRRITSASAQLLDDVLKSD